MTRFLLFAGLLHSFLTLGVVSDAEAAIRLDFAGCTEVLDGPICLLDETRRVRLFIAHPIDAMIVLDPDPGTAGSPVAGGSRFEMDVPDGIDRIEVEVQVENGSRRLGLTVGPARSKPQWLEHVAALHRAGHLDSAREIAERWTTRGPLGDRGRAYFLLAHYQDRAGETAAAETSRLAAVRVFQRSGRTSWASLIRAQLHASRLNARRFAEAEALETDWPTAAGDAVSAFDRLYARSLRQKALGAPRQALADLLAARALAFRLDLTARYVAAEDARADLLMTSGRHAEAQAVSICLAASHGADLHPCSSARLLNDVAWSRLLERDAEPHDPWQQQTLDELCPGVGAPVDTTDIDLLIAGAPRPLLDRALERFATDCPQQLDEQANVRMNRAFADLQEGRLDRALHTLDALRDRPPNDGDMVLWDLALRSSLALAGNQPQDALEISHLLDELALATAWPEGRWRAAVMRARALEALGRVDAAIEAHAVAETLLDTELMALPRHAGRLDLPHWRRRAVGHHIDLLVAEGRPEEALRVARRSRSRFSRSLLFSSGDGLSPEIYSARRDAVDALLADSWAWSNDRLERRRHDAARDLEALRSELDVPASTVRVESGPTLGREPADGELWLSFHPGERGWWLFASHVDGVEAHRLDEIDPLLESIHRQDSARLAEAWSGHLLAPISNLVRRAEAIRVLAHGALHALDVHALPFDGAPLIERAMVTYAVDLPSIEPLRHRGPIVVIGDPGGDLAAARREAATLAERLAPLGPLHHLDGVDATGAAVRRRLDGADHVHYAGHAHFAGWDSHLPLADGSSLTVDDILALRRPPRTVVLASCEAGRAVGAGGREAFDLARAFAIAGSTTVIAATRPVPDAVTGQLMATLYDAWTGPSGLAGDPAAALRHAQRRLRETDPDADWAAFRLIQR